ncbi:MAG: DUF4129 domain-containing protein, partial [Dehalococcoidia bacterium]|nr:DUF4129 domain-containing protein [Dehalococcoidia bacterium]
AFILSLALRFAWERSFRGLTGAERRWAKVQRLAGWAGILPPDDRTPAEAARFLEDYVAEPVALGALARAFTVARYGHAQDEPAEAARALDEDYRRVSRPLWRLPAGRVFRLGRTPRPRRTLPPFLPGGNAPAGLRR